jgi:transketolase N-terminal domain/subunit
LCGGVAIVGEQNVAAEFPDRRPRGCAILAPAPPVAENDDPASAFAEMIDSNRYPRLARIDSPADLRRLPEGELADVARELRAYLIESVASSGGHFGANLGVIELTVVLHWLYDTPVDRLVWDVGHQCYPHKILTGRRDRITTIKKKDGLAPFPKRDESEYDTFGVGHSSTSISAALGMAIAAQRRDDHRKVVAVIGDGAMTAGMAFEALNHGGDVEPDILVILNDNQMSISENVGALPRMLARLMASRTLNRIREHGKKMMKRDGFLWRVTKRWEEHAKGMFVPSTLFEELGCHYTGPIDGHDIPLLVSTLRTLKELKGPQLLHVITTKGKGYAPAEREQIEYHAVGPFDPQAGLVKKAGASKPTYTEIFGDWLCDMAAADPRLYGITPAMRDGSGLVRFSKEFPQRYFDVSIAEQHAVTLAAGMACEGAKPVVAIYSTFLQRAYDQLIHDVALQNLDVLFAIDRAGLVGPDGALHPEHARDGAGRRERMPQDADHRLPPQRSGRSALPARQRHRRCGFKRTRDPADRQGGNPPPWPRHRPARVRCDGRAMYEGRRHARCDPGQHALREAARRGVDSRTRQVARSTGHNRGQRDRRRCRQCRRRASECTRYPGAATADRPFRSLPRPRESRGTTGERRSRRRRHRKLDSPPLRQPARGPAPAQCGLKKDPARSAGAKSRLRCVEPSWRPSMARVSFGIASCNTFCRP